MRKIAMTVLALAFVASSAMAATTKDTLKTESKKWGTFWSKEGERSGMKESTSSWGKFWQNANPVNFFHQQKEAYDARKAGQPASGVTVK